MKLTDAQLADLTLAERLKKDDQRTIDGLCSALFTVIEDRTAAYRLDQDYRMSQITRSVYAAGLIALVVKESKI